MNVENYYDALIIRRKFAFIIIYITLALSGKVTKAEASLVGYLSKNTRLLDIIMLYARDIYVRKTIPVSH